MAAHASQCGGGLASPLFIMDHDVAVIHSRAGDSIDGYGDGHEIVITHGEDVRARSFVDDEENTFRFKIAVSKAVMPQELRSGVLEVLPVFGMMQISHRVAFRISHAEFYTTGIAYLSDGRSTHPTGQP